MRNIRLSIGVVALVLLSLVVSAAAQQPAGKSMPAVTLTGSDRVLLLQAEPKSPEAFQRAQLLLRATLRPAPCRWMP